MSYSYLQILLLLLALFQGGCSSSKIYPGFQWRSKFVKIHDCSTTPCSEIPLPCPDGYEYFGYSLLTHHTQLEECEPGKSKNFCCRKDLGPDCVKTECNTRPQCPPKYWELDRDEVTCAEENEAKLVCCVGAMAPRSFTTSCSIYNDVKCPPSYTQTQVLEGKAGCPQNMTRINCDKPPPGPQ